MYVSINKQRTYTSMLLDQMIGEEIINVEVMRNWIESEYGIYPILLDSDLYNTEQVRWSSLLTNPNVATIQIVQDELTVSHDVNISMQKIKDSVSEQLPSLILTDKVEIVDLPQQKVENAMLRQIDLLGWSRIKSVDFIAKKVFLEVQDTLASIQFDWIDSNIQIEVKDNVFTFITKNWCNSYGNLALLYLYEKYVESFTRFMDILR